MENEQAYKVWISGRVQGVFFRKYTAERAIKLGLKGFVQNLPDGRVYTEVEGAEGAIAKFLEWLWQGSPSSEVVAVDKLEMEPMGADRFFIKR